MLQAVAINNEDKLVNSVSSLVEAATYLKVTTPEELSNATDIVKLIKTKHKEIDGERTALVKPLNDTVDRINGRFKTILAPLKTAEDEVKAKMLTFQQEEVRKAEEARREAERKAAEETARIAKEQAEAAPDAPVAIVEVVPVLPPAAPRTSYGSFGGTSSMKKVWVFELEDIQKLAAARPDLVTVDASKVNAEIKGKGGEIPGLKIYQKDTIAVR